MNRCLDEDTLVSLGAALDWDPDEGLRHVVDCQSCQQQLRQLSQLHRDLTEEMKPRLGFTDDVIRSIGVHPNRHLAVANRMSPLSALNALLASVAVFFATAYASAGDPQMQLDLLPAILVSLAGGAVTLWWNRTHPSTIVDSTR
ncbi:MAG: hypothetical protein IIA27_13775 [Gemmatimonadetes bacterium]|nr:hypothetical protein [Gemmatimonadota bacterium]